MLFYLIIFISTEKDVNTLHRLNIGLLILSVNAGVSITFLTFVICFIITVFLAVAADKYLKRYWL
jgi:uncharacterized membrane protein (DUF485 family)